MIAVVVAVIGSWATVMVAWFDTRKRTNGAGPLAAKLDIVLGRLDRIEGRQERLDDRLERHTTLAHYASQ